MSAQKNTLPVHRYFVHAEMRQCEALTNFAAGYSAHAELCRRAVIRALIVQCHKWI